MGEDMELTLRMAAIETILFAMGDSVEMSVIAQALEITEEEAEEAVDALEKRCQSPESGLCINRFEDSVQLSSKPEHYEYLVKIAKAPKKQVLTDTLMETLSIIAFKQPVTRAEVENIRGVNSDFAISKLVSYDLVQEMGRKEAPGRPLLFGIRNDAAVPAIFRHPVFGGTAGSGHGSGGRNARRGRTGG